ncbi:hypothetical protein ACSFBL_09085 [Variovorax sp. GT1P44]
MMTATQTCAAESTQAAAGSNSTSSRLQFNIAIPPVFRVLQVTPIKEGYQYRVWTNVSSIRLNGIEYRFDRLGENTLIILALPGELMVVHGL